MKVSSKKPYERMKPMNKLVRMPCKVVEDGTVLKAYNNTKDLIYVTNFDVDNLTTFDDGLKQLYNISEVSLAHWIRPRNEESKALLITFNESRTPSSLYIPGETRVRVYPYLDRPLLCNNCFGYGHPAKYCKNSQRCVEVVIGSESAQKLSRNVCIAEEIIDQEQGNVRNSNKKKQSLKYSSKRKLA